MVCPRWFMPVLVPNLHHFHPWLFETDQSHQALRYCCHRRRRCPASNHGVGFYFPLCFYSDTLEEPAVFTWIFSRSHLLLQNPCQLCISLSVKPCLHSRSIPWQCISSSPLWDWFVQRSAQYLDGSIYWDNLSRSRSSCALFQINDHNWFPSNSSILTNSHFIINLFSR